MKTKAKKKKIFRSYTHLKKNKAENKKKKQKSLNSKESEKTKP